MKVYDVVVIGGGQSGLASAYYLRRTELSWVVLDNQHASGGAWQHGWDSLRLFSPAEFSSLPGWLMPKSDSYYPDKTEILSYLTKYEQRYGFPVERPVQVERLHWNEEDQLFRIETNKGDYWSRAVIAATGTWASPFIPDVPGREDFRGAQIHSAQYQNPGKYRGKRVLVIGGANSGAQIMAEIEPVAASATWVSKEEPQFLPDDVDGRVLFDAATARYHAMKSGRPLENSGYGLGKIVMVPSVAEARNRGVLTARTDLHGFTSTGVRWADGTGQDFDAVIWCTGFRYNTAFLGDIIYLSPEGKVKTVGTRSVELPSLWLVGYGSWTGFASSTLIGVGRTARSTVDEIILYLEKIKHAHRTV